MAGDDDIYLVSLSNGSTINVEPDDCFWGPAANGRFKWVLATDLQPGFRLAPPDELAPGEIGSPPNHAVFGRRYRDGTAALPHLSDLPGPRLRQWRQEEATDGRAFDLQDLVRELHLAGASPLTRETIIAWERDWLPGRAPNGSLGLVNGPQTLSQLRALAQVTEVPDFNTIFAAAAVGHVYAHLHWYNASVDQTPETEQSEVEVEWQEVQRIQATPPWWPMVVSVQRFQLFDTAPQPSQTLADVYSAHNLGPAVAALIETQRLYADNRSVGGALWVYVPQEVRAAHWTWARHNRAGRWGMYCNRGGEVAGLLTSLAAEYAEQHGIAGLLGLLVRG
jgi:hypothetical protein